jgi:2-oxoglutarate dehydrogenase E2 component (dihydrolipoamide succinyltransferase)
MPVFFDGRNDAILHRNQQSMALEIKVPSVGESITEVSLAKWLKPDGSFVERDEVIAELESEKATFEINAEQAGKITHTAKEGDSIPIGAVIGSIDTSAVPAAEPEAKASSKKAAKTEKEAVRQVKVTPVAAAMMAENKIDTGKIRTEGRGRISKQDVIDAIEHPEVNQSAAEMPLFSRTDRTEKMSNLRKTISRRLVEAKNATAMLTTFNEVDMSPIMEIRKKYKDTFKEKHGVNLGFMSFFTKACCLALKQFPAVNAYIDGENIIYHDYCDISIAVSAPKGLVVPVIRNAESLTMAEIEKKVVELAGKARDSKLTVEEMSGGTFTITNGGVFGSMLSTPIINIPQSAILGMHNIVERPIALNGQVVIRPMMYVALSYDHRIIDGRESVSFLVMVKQLLENPSMLLSGKDPISSLLQL